MKKKWATKCNGKLVRHGARGYHIGQIGTKKWQSYCDRILGIAKEFSSARLPCSPNYLSRRKWRCPLDEVER